MAKVWNRNNLIPWICNEEEEDFFAALGDYRLRVEQIGKDQWWWNVSYRNHDIMTDLNNFATCRTNAILLAEGVYYGHKAACMETNLSLMSMLLKENKHPGPTNHQWTIKPKNHFGDDGNQN